MADDLGPAAAGLLVDQSDAAYGEGRYGEAAAAAGRAVQAARHLDDLVLLVRALRMEAAALSMLGDDAAALARFTEILGLAQDPANSARLDHPDAADAIARAHWDWVECARFLTSIPVRDLFGVLDAADRWLAATGHRHWRAAVLSSARTFTGGWVSSTRRSAAPRRPSTSQAAAPGSPRLHAGRLPV